jgi:nucleoside-diphosphate-sugar epimerase
MCPGNMLDIESLKYGLGDSKVVFHCVYGNTNDPVMNARINEEGLLNLGELALRNGVERLIHLSTVSVYGPDAPDIVTEETPLCFSGDEYGDSKIRTEAICQDLRKRGLPVVIIRPTFVFGPFSPIWTIGAMKRVLAGGWENTADITGLCNPVYIDDLVSGLFLCIENDNACGETFILSGPEPVPWNDFFNAYKDIAGLKHSNLPVESTGHKTRGGLFGPFLRSNVRLLRKFIEPQMIDAYEWLKVSRPALARKLSALLGGGVQESEKKRFNQKSVYSISKARSHLGYAPQSFGEGMEKTAAWLIYYEYVSRAT